MQNRKILLVEDEHKIADTLKIGLVENGYEVDLAYDGKSGHELFTSEVYNLIVLDINLPQINGYELCKIIRKENSQVPIIMLTALSTLNNKIEGYDAGADDYLVKPFEFRELLLKIRALLKRTETVYQEQGILIRAGELQMNLDSKQVKRGDTEILLTAKEFQLLEYLIRNKNRVLSRADIAMNVWEIDFDTNTNIIDVYINYVRNKVDKPFEYKFIQTQVGMGYILKEN